MAPVPAETSQTLDRGLRVLRVLAESPEGLTVTELSNRLQVNRTVVYRLISTLEQHGLVRRDARSRLFVGLGVLHLASGVQPLLRDLAMPVLRGLAESLGSTAAPHRGRRGGGARAGRRRAVVDRLPRLLPGRRPPPADAGRGRQGHRAGASGTRRRTPSRAASCRPAPAASPLPCGASRDSRASVGVVTLDGAIDEDVVAPQVIAAAAAVAERLR